MTLNLTIPQQLHADFTPRIKVVGVGGGGTNAVDNMIQLKLMGVEFVVANTDAQQLMHSMADIRIQLGPHLTQGLGAGAKPEIGRAAAEEAADEISRHLEGAHMVFITAGMGGGTGTGAAPVIARMARERGILTVGVVTKPFTFEGGRRAKSAEVGINELQQFVDTLIVIPNQNLFRLANERTGWKEAFKMADHVLYMGVRGVTDLMVAPGLVNLDFADIRTVMAEMGKAMMGTGEAEGENRAIRAAEAAISNPLLEDTSMAGARGLLINITGGDDMTLYEVDQAANRIREEVAEDANIIFGSAIDETLCGKVRVSVVATGIDMPVSAESRPRLAVVAGGAAGQLQGHLQAQAGQMPVQHAPAPILGAPVAPGAASSMQGVMPQMSAMTPAMAMAAQEAAQAALQQASAPYPAQPVAPRAPEPGQPYQQAYPMAAQSGQQAPAPLTLHPASAMPQGASHGMQQGTPALTTPVPMSQPGARSTLFASAPVAQPTVSAPSPGRNLFGIVTGALRRGVQPVAAEPRGGQGGQQAGQHGEQGREQRREPEIQQASAEDELDIPAFLRRQSS